ncbi:MAG: TetR/AcrR family transcriptional regulator [Gemmatimonadetes bacterium]|jgi:AcrR family transcriptional regulator|nr:TetR/AcrR family transcriptional regulator [Gemmatimonadota bacterium]
MNPAVEAASDPKWRRLPEERPQQILIAAIEVFAEHGIADAKLEEIAARAGVSKGTIYLYFASKEELFRAVVQQLLVPRIVEVERALHDGTPTQQLERYMRLQWAHFDQPGTAGWIRLVLTELHKHPDLQAFYYAEVIAASNQTLGEIVKRGVATGEFRTIDPPVVVSMFKSMALMHVLWSQTPRPVNVAHSHRATIDDMVDFVLHALRPDAPR